MTEFADQSILPKDKKNYLTPDVLKDNIKFENWLNENVNIPFKGFDKPNPIQATREQLLNFRDAMIDDPRISDEQLVIMLLDLVPTE